jgi:hypothetical protein
VTSTTSEIASRAAEAQHLGDLAQLRRVRDRIDREYAQPLEVDCAFPDPPDPHPRATLNRPKEAFRNG